MILASSSVRAQYFMDQLPEAARQRMRPLGRQLELWLIHLDPPDHTRVRSLVHKAFAPRVVEGLRTRIHKIVNELLDGAQQAGAMDVMGDFAYPLTAAVIAELLGIPPEDRTQFSQWSDSINGFVGAAALRHEELNWLSPVCLSDGIPASPHRNASALAQR